MFESLLVPVARAVESAIARYAIWVAVAVLFLIAAGFATAALAIYLVELYGALLAYTLMALLFVALGTVGAAVAQIILAPPQAEPMETESDAETAEAEETGTGAVANVPLPPEFVMAALSSAAPAAAPVIARSILRNLPLLIVVAILAYLFSLTAGSEEPAEQTAAP